MFVESDVDGEFRSVNSQSLALCAGRESASSSSPRFLASISTVQSSLGGPRAACRVEVSVLGQGCEALVTRYGDLVIVAQP